MKKSLPILILISLLGNYTYAQKKPNPALTADSLATANYKDVLNSFFQLAVDKFTGPDKELRFTSNPYAVMAKLDTSLLMDREYYKYRRLRNLNFSVAAKLDSSYRFNGFSSGVKYALINKRDETVSNAFLVLVSDNLKTQEISTLNLDLDQYISTLSTDPELQDKLIDDKTAFTRGTKTFNQLEPVLQKKIKELLKAKNAKYLLSLIETDPKLNILKTAQQVYKDVRDYYNNRLLWTVGFTDTTYKDQFMFSNIVVTSELVKGIDSLKQADIELNLKTSFQMVDDTLNTGRDLKRSVFSFEPGVNFVLKTKGTQKSFFELKLSGSYSHTFSTLYTNEERNRLTLNGTIRIRIINDIWVPLEIKYDPKTGNVFGFLNVRANFTSLANLMKGG